MDLQVMGFPVVMLVRFWVNHHLLDLVQRPVWRTVTDRTCQYVHKIIQGACPLHACLHVHCLHRQLPDVLAAKQPQLARHESQRWVHVGFRASAKTVSCVGCRLAPGRAGREVLSGSCRTLLTQMP